MAGSNSMNFFMALCNTILACSAARILSLKSKEVCVCVCVLWRQVKIGRASCRHNQYYGDR